MSALPRVKLVTTSGDIMLELFADDAPATVENFLQYVEDGFYANTIFHRVIDGFMIQGGGMEEDLHQKQTRESIKNEADNGIGNLIGTIAMARTGDPHSASSQFFINVANNHFLDHKEPTGQGWGYCVFGRVIDGMEAVDAIKQSPTESRRGMQDVPVDTVTITAAEVLPAE